jgi:hypothetical protein
MKKMICILSLLLLFVTAFNCSKEEEAKPDPIKEKVDAAKLIEGTSPFDVKIKASFIDIPGKGYLVFDPIQDEDREALFNAVYIKYKSDFDKVKKHTPANAKVNNMQIVCGEWASINSGDPNSWVYRYCCNLSSGVCDRQTKECAYC